MKKSGLLIFILLFLVGCSTDLEDERVTYEYNNDGIMIKKSIDINGDGEIDEVTNYEVDSDGSRIKSVYGIGMGGKVDMIWTFEYDDDGNYALKTKYKKKIQNYTYF